MKFSEKIIWSCFLVLTFVFSLGSMIMIYQNHQVLFNHTVDQCLSDYHIQIYSLESRLFQDAQRYETEYGKNEDKMLERIEYYLNQFQKASLQQIENYTLLSVDNQKLASNITTLQQNYATTQYDQTYFIESLEGKQYLFVTSSFHAGKDTFYLSSSYDISSVYQERQRQLQSFLIIALLLLGMAFFILRYVSRYLTRSILKLNEVSKRIAEGQYDERTCIESLDEIGELSHNFDRMAEMNEQKIHQLEQSVIQKEEFMGSFSHEIKTPMTTILGFADLLRTCDMDEETRQKAVQYIYQEGQRLERLSYTLMKLLSLSEEKIDLERVSIHEFVVELQNYYLQQKLSQKLIFHYDSGEVLSHHELLFVLMRNLIDNARKASKDNQNIEISIYYQEHGFLFVVCDHGRGMSQEAIEKATEPFYMEDKSRSRMQGGAGLGLTIVNRILELHHSQLKIESLLHQGTTISFWLEEYHEV